MTSEHQPPTKDRIFVVKYLVIPGTFLSKIPIMTSEHSTQKSRIFAGTIMRQPISSSSLSHPLSVKHRYNIIYARRAATATFIMWTMNYLLPCLLALNLRHVTIVCAWANNNYWAYRHGHPMTPLSLISRTTATKSTYSSSTTRLASTTEASSSSSAAANSADFTLPHLELSHIQHLAQHGYVVIPDFISEDFQAALREDLYHLRSQQYFKQNLVGKDDVDSSILRELQEYLRVKGYIHLVRVVESCRLDLALPETKTTARQLLLQLLQQLPQDLVMHANVLSHHTAKTRHIPTRQLDTSTPFSSTTWHEYLYAYYPQGAFMSRHVDEEPGSAFDFRCYSLLLYLNDNEIWKSKDDHGGQLRLHL